jgi:hypothetical protein
MIYDAWKIQGLRTKLTDGEKRHEFKSTHGFRKIFETKCQKAKMNHNNIKILMDHSLGESQNYHRPTEEELLEDYLNVIHLLTVSEEIGLYYHLCTYGEDIIKPLKWLGLIVLVGSLYWYLIYFTGTNPNQEFLVSVNSSIYEFSMHKNEENVMLNAVERTLQNIISFNDDASIGDILIRMASATVLGGIAITLRRKIEWRT